MRLASKLVAASLLLIVSAGVVSAQVDVESGFTQPSEVEAGSTVQNQLFNVNIHSLSLDGDTDRVYVKFPAELAENNSLADQKNGVSSNVSVGSSMTAADRDGDGTVETLKAGLQEDGEGNATAEVTFDTAVEYPDRNTTYTFNVEVVDSKTGTATETLGTVTVGQGEQSSEEGGNDQTRGQNDSSEETDPVDETEPSEDTDSSDTGSDTETDSSTDTDTEETTTDENNTENTTREQENSTIENETEETSTPSIERPEQGLMRVEFSNVQEGEVVSFQTSKETGLQEVELSTVEDTNLTVTIEETPNYRVEGKKVFTAQRIDANAEVKSANLTYEVNKGWIQRQEKDVVIKRLDSGDWDVLNTEKVSETNSTVSYSAETPGFSRFAVTTFKDVETQTQETNETSNTSPTGQATGSTPGIQSVLLAVMLIFLIVGAAYFYRRR